MKILSGSTLSEGMDYMEAFILQKILSWKVSYETPFDFINLITKRFAIELKLEKSKELSIITKANQICELLLLCMLDSLDFD